MPAARRVDPLRRSRHSCDPHRGTALRSITEDYTVFKCGPWTQGPYLLETLQLLEGFDLAALGHDQPKTIHVTLEAMKLALADRDVFYGDPLVRRDVPIETLLSTPTPASAAR